MVALDSRSGKTFILVYAIMVRACKEKSRHVILRQKFNHVKTSILMDTFPSVMSAAFPNLSFKINKTDYVVNLENGSEIWFAGLDDKERTEKILGKEYSTLYFNECSQLSYSSVLMAVTRLAQKNKLGKKVYLDMNPPSKSHWAYWLFEKGFDPYSEEYLNQEEYRSLLMNPSDNIENLDPEYLKILEKMPEAERNRFLLGLFADTNQGLAYYSFDRERHIGECSLEYGTVFVGMDFNVNPMTATIFQEQGGVWCFIDEIFLENSDTYRMSDELIKKGYRGANIIPDSTGKNRKTSGKSDHIILKDNGFNVMNTRNPYVKDRVNNVNRLFTSDKIRIDPRCKKLIKDLECVAWKDEKLDQKSDTMLTHISDALGYGMWKLDKIERKDSGFNASKAR